jgi:hypothetical protein
VTSTSHRFCSTKRESLAPSGIANYPGVLFGPCHHLDNAYHPPSLRRVGSLLRDRTRSCVPWLPFCQLVRHQRVPTGSLRRLLRYRSRSAGGPGSPLSSRSWLTRRTQRPSAPLLRSHGHSSNSRPEWSWRRRSIVAPRASSAFWRDSVTARYHLIQVSIGSRGAFTLTLSTGTA